MVQVPFACQMCRVCQILCGCRQQILSRQPHCPTDGINGSKRWQKDEEKEEKKKDEMVRQKKKKEK